MENGMLIDSQQLYTAMNLIQQINFEIFWKIYGTSGEFIYFETCFEKIILDI